MRNDSMMRLLPVFVMSALVGAGCAVESGGYYGVEPDPVEISYSLDAVKLITPRVRRADDPSTYLQHAYSIGPDSRLLMRFEGLSNHLGKVQASDIQRIKVRITVRNELDADPARTAFRICPVARQWMMLATWWSSHPFGARGHWGTQGGDYVRDGCVAASPLLPAAEGGASSGNDAASGPEPVAPVSPVTISARTLSFDVTQWFVDYPRGRLQNHGLVLISDQVIAIEGDASPSYSPRLVWEERPRAKGSRL